MRLSSFITLCTVLILTTFLISPSKAQTTCTFNDLGDRTCTTVTSGVNIPGTTTGNVLNNSTFGTGTNTTTTGWSTDGDEGIHTHGVGDFGQKYNGYVDQGGTLAFHGHEDDNVYQDVDLVGDGHLTKSQINEGFTSTMSADVWFWNNVENTLTLKQTITTPDGTVTTQTRNINDDGGNRTWNTGSYVNYTDSYTHNSNTETDFTIRAEVYNNTAGTSYDSGHYGPDVDNVELSITTAGSVTQGTSSTVFTPCSELGTCTYDNEAVEDAVDLRTEDGKPIFDDVDDKVDDAVKNFEEVKFTPIVETVIEVKDDLGKLEEVKFEEFVEMQFTSFIEENNLVEEFKEELKVEGLTEEEFFDELGGAMKEELGGEIMADMEEFKEEEMPNDITTEAPTEEIKEETTTEEFKEEKTEEGELNATETTTNEKTETEEIVQGNEEEDKTGPEDKNVSAESEVDNDKETEGQTETEDSGETVEDTAGVSVEDGKTLDAKVSSITEKVARVIKKLEEKLKRVDDKLNATAYVLAVGLQSTQPDISSYSNKRIYQNNNLGYKTNDDFFDLINRIEQQQIYKDVSLNAYTSKDPIAVQSRLLNEIDQKKAKLKAEIAALRSM
ncbi:hypothetical protein Mosig_00201 [Pelagibacter phage Mosig EXVC030M]|nr:hypothetical protein Mosig_00201 [Pelagibacter phage Mosig EXVC030M]